jgi:type IV pilus assembly protein PilX
MILPTRCGPRAQRGVVLVSAMLLLIVLTILALYMFRSNGIQELIAGNIREKQRAVQTAEAAEMYAEMWLSTPGNVLTNSVNCAAVGVVAWPNVPNICTFPLQTITGASAASVPWKVGGSEIGFSYFPGSTTGTGDLLVQTTGGLNTYYQVPRFYIGLVQSTGRQALYRIDAWNYAGTPNTVSVVESNYIVTCSTCTSYP